MPFLLSLLGSRTAWIVLAFAAIAAWGGIQTYRLRSTQTELVKVTAEHKAFVAQTKAIGEQQEAKAKAIDAANRAAKEKADVENAKTRRDLAGLYDSYRRLRDSRAGSGSGILPGVAPGSANPARADFDRAALDSALSNFDRGITGLIAEGDEAIADLNSAKAWAQKR